MTDDNDDLTTTTGVPIVRDHVPAIPPASLAPEVEGWDPASPHARPLTDLGRAAGQLSPALLERLVSLSRTPQLLVATDYDGTVAPIVNVPSQAYPLPASVIAMRALATLPATEVAVISGRSLRDLAAMSRLPVEVHLVGSHGSEFTSDTVTALPATLADKLASLRSDAGDIARERPGVRIEEKPAGLAIHVRGVEPHVREKVLGDVRDIAERLQVYATEGKQVIDLSVVHTSKGAALRALRSRLGSSAAMYIGDDTSDERALATLQGPDLGIKVVGADDDARTAAAVTVPDPATVSLVLATLYDLRRAWLFGRSSVPIERHSLIANGQSSALIDPEGRICWMPHPLPHSASMFSEILGTEAAGYFAIGTPGGSKSLSQRYVAGTAMVETRWPGFKSTDYLAPSDENITTLVRVLDGDRPASITFAPRLDYGTAPTRLEKTEDGIAVQGTAEPIELHAPGVEFTIFPDGNSDTAVAEVPLDGRPVVIALSCGGSVDARAIHASEEPELRRQASRWWTEWVAGLDIPKYQSGLVSRSAITLRSLCHAPTGGVVAAATTSLPEGIGGTRNWDYRTAGCGTAP